MKISYTIIFATLLVNVNSDETSSSTSPAPTEFNARVVTDLEVIYGAHGVPVNYFQYNETSSGGRRLTSVPGCPKSIDGYPWIYYGEPPRCFLAGHNGPCPFGERLFPKLGTPFGICACECLVANGTWTQISRGPARYVYCKNSDFVEARNGQIYDKQEKKCYTTYRQGPCKTGTVATWKEDTLTCIPLCDYKNPDWEDLYKRKACDFEPSAGFGLSTTILGGQCPADERYSETLKKCVKDLGVDL